MSGAWPSTRQPQKDQEPIQGNTDSQASGSGVRDEGALASLIHTWD